VGALRHIAWLDQKVGWSDEDSRYYLCLSGNTMVLYSFESELSTSKRFKKAVYTSAVRSLACKLLPFLAKDSLEHSC
jgi:hypothetical protein